MTNFLNFQKFSFAGINKNLCNITILIEISHMYMIIMTK